MYIEVVHGINDFHYFLKTCQQKVFLTWRYSQGKTALLNSVQELLKKKLDCFWLFSYVNRII